MINVGITGSDGFMGTNLLRFLRSKKDQIQVINFQVEWFDDFEMLCKFVQKCDTIVHLAGVNRHEDEKYLYDRNVHLAKLLCEAAEVVNTKPDIIFSSSTQEHLNNNYGNAKKEARLFLANWCRSRGTKFAGLVIPNVYGPFGKPFYNSFVSTFCYLLADGKQPEIQIDRSVGLIYVFEVISAIYELIISPKTAPEIDLKVTAEYKVSEILQKLNLFVDSYVKEAKIPELKSYFDITLFNTFRSYLMPHFYPFKLGKKVDDRGFLTEIIKENTGGQVFYSLTKPGIVRGNHYHTDKIERFCVLQGEALIKLRRICDEEIIEYKVSGETPVIVDMPVYYTHNIQNIGSTDLLTLFWSNEIFDPEKPDTIFEEV
jgi:UDP-2-acetamido-2,6-beta-L-arabino-hexul-4-ose reductase